MTGQGSQLARRVHDNAPSRQEEPDAETQVREAIKRRLPTIKALLPDVLDERKLAALVITEVYKNPELAECDEASLIGCVLRAAALGLQFGQDLGEAYLIPRREQGKPGKTCTLQLGYKGVRQLAFRSGEVASITTRAVYAGDDFDYAYGLDERLHHIPRVDPGAIEDKGGDQGPVTHAYAVVRFVNGGRDWEVLTRAQCLARKGRGKGAQPAWRSDFAKMCEKSALLAMRARLPLSSEVARALADDGAAITVSSRGGQAALEAHHDDTPALDPPRQVDASTGEVSPPAPDDHRPPPPDDTKPQTAVDVAAVLEQAGVTPPLHLAVVLRASNGRTADMAALTEREVHLVANLAKSCAAGPEGFVRAILSKLKPGADGSEELGAWLAELSAERAPAAEPDDDGRPFDG